MEAAARPWNSVVEMRDYAERARKLLTEVEQDAIVQMIALDPTCGVLVKGTSGLRKMRFGVGDRGRSGGVRVVYYFHSDALPAYLLALFAKNEKDNMSGNELNRLARFVEVLKRRRRRS